MKKIYLGIDIGTTTICGVISNEDGSILESKTIKNDSHLPIVDAARCQNPERILSICKEIISSYEGLYEIVAIGFSCQMHGILYIDENGNSLSNLYSWQDQRGNLIYKDNETYVRYLTKKTKYNLASGFGGVSLFFDYVNNNVPKNAKKIVTIGDFVAMKLANRTTPLANATLGASLGFYNLKDKKYDKKALDEIGLPLSYFPDVEYEPSIIGYMGKTAIYSCIADNQAPIYGVSKTKKELFLNYGTASQALAIIDKLVDPPIGLEVRPYFNNKYMVLGCSLCGGDSLRLLLNFVNSIKGENNKIDYPELLELAKKGKNSDIKFMPTFNGQRFVENPKFASISNLQSNNFNIENIAYSLIEGMCDELYDFYSLFKDNLNDVDMIVGSGNGLRLNPVLQDIIKEKFKLDIYLPLHNEEAAFGAMLYVMEHYLNKDLKNLIVLEKL